MKSRQTEDSRSAELAKRHLLCWSKGVQTQLLRAELADGSFLLFPYTHLLYVRFEPRDTGDLLSLVLDTHEIAITGRNLRELGLALQDFAVDWVRELPARYAASANHDSVHIAGIKVTEIQAPQ